MSNSPETPNTQPETISELALETDPEAILEQATQVERPAPRPRRSSQDRKRQNSVFFYLTILFVAAFLLLSLSMMMERRQHSEDMDNLNQSLKDSVSAMQSVQALYEENDALKAQIAQLEEQLKDATTEADGLSKKLKDQTKATQAMDWFWQIDEAYVRSRWSTARGLIQQLKEAGLEEYLPQESITNNERFSPADRYKEIYNALY